jgi:hypothetical protein
MPRCQWVLRASGSALIGASIYTDRTKREQGQVRRCSPSVNRSGNVRPNVRGPIIPIHSQNLPSFSIPGSRAVGPFLPRLLILKAPDTSQVHRTRLASLEVTIVSNTLTQEPALSSRLPETPTITTTSLMTIPEVLAMRQLKYVKTIW